MLTDLVRRGQTNRAYPSLQGTVQRLSVACAPATEGAPRLYGQACVRVRRRCLRLRKHIVPSDRQKVRSSAGHGGAVPSYGKWAIWQAVVTGNVQVWGSTSFTPWRALMSTGTVKWFNPTKGYGFIQPQGGGQDVFVHISAVERAGLTTLNEGQHVEFEIVSNRGKSSAENLKVK